MAPNITRKRWRTSFATPRGPTHRQLTWSMRDHDRLVVWKLDRLGRTLTGVIEAVEKMTSQNIELISLTEKVDTSSAMGRAFFNIALVFAQLRARADRRADQGRHGPA